MSLALREYFWEAWPAAPSTQASAFRLDELEARIHTAELGHRIRLDEIAR